MQTPSVEAIPGTGLDLATAREATLLLQEAWPKPDFVEAKAAEQRLAGWRAEPVVGSVPPLHYVVREGGHVVAHATAGVREIAAGDRRLVVLALAAVAVRGDRRGKGYGVAVVRAALSRIDDGTLAFGLWQTGDARVFYERLGAVLAPNRFVNSLSATDPRARPWWEPDVMRYPAGPGWPEGEIDLLGPGY